MVNSLVKSVAEAVLYEGYLLYPYRPSSVKNQQRWNFGVLCPESYSRAQQGTESWTMQTQVLVESGPETKLEIAVAFLHLVNREGIFQQLQEAVEREAQVCVDDLATVSQRFSFPHSRTVESFGDGEVIRTQEAIEGVVEVHVESLESLRKVTVQVRNLTQFDNAEVRTRDEALLHSFVSTHTILSVQNGEFVSLLDPPERFRGAADSCVNVGTYPVLVGEDGARYCMLSSPIILYDYPQIATESAGNLFDGTEIDEILTLRIMTLTDDEKYEMRHADARARALLERTEALGPEQLMKMHGVMKSK